jgi:hypothetical protein
VLVVLLGLIAPIVLSFVERERPAANRAFELEYLPKGEYLRIAALGYRQVIADLIWLKAVYHFGERKQTKAGYRWVYHAVDVLTDLDPKFAMAYYAAGTILGVWSGQINESIAILEKGMRHNSDMWQLPFVIGYDYYYELCDPVRAAGYFRQASLLPGAPDYLPRPKMNVCEMHSRSAFAKSCRSETFVSWKKQSVGIRLSMAGDLGASRIWCRETSSMRSLVRHSGNLTCWIGRVAACPTPDCVNDCRYIVMSIAER